MVSSRLKEVFEGFVVSRVRPLASLGVTPNALTVAGLLVSVGAAACYVYWWAGPLMLPAAAALILLSGLIDAIDGVLARSTDSVTSFGGFLDSVSDRYSDAIVLSGIVYAGLCDLGWGLAAIVGSLMVSYARARAEAAGVKMIAVGLAERAERMVFLALATLASYFWTEALGWGVIALAVLVQFTVLQRAAHFFREVENL